MSRRCDFRPATRRVFAAVMAVCTAGTVPLRADSKPDPALPAAVVELRAAVAAVEVRYSGTSGPISQSGVAGAQRRYDGALVRQDPGTVPTGLSSSEVARSTAQQNAVYQSQRVLGTSTGPLTDVRSRSSGSVELHLDAPLLRAPGVEIPGGEMPASHGVYDHFVDAPFLPQLHSRILRAQLSGGLQKEVEAYLIEQEKLGREIETALAAVHSNPAALRELGVRQTPRLAAWEQLGEELRRKLARGNLVAGNAFNEFENRRWQLDEAALRQTRERNRGKEASAARLTAYFSDGLSPVQRRLLREAAAGLDHGRDSARRRGGSPFLPEFARLELPAGLPPALTAELAAIAGLKGALQQELLDAVYFNDQKSEAARRGIFAKLAVAQAPRISELERRIEAVRPELAAHLLGPNGATLPDLPTTLRDRLERFTASQRTLEEKLKSLRASAVERRPDPPRVLRLHTTERSTQGEQILAVLALFEGQNADALEKLEQGGGADVTATDQDLGKQLRVALAKLQPVGPAQFRYSCDRSATTEDQRARARTQFATVWERRADLTGPLEAEATRLQTELSRVDATGTVALIRQLRAHWRDVERTARVLSFELGLLAAKETDAERDQRLADAKSRSAEIEQRERELLKEEERAIRAELAGLHGGAAFGGLPLETVLEDDQRRQVAWRNQSALLTYRSAVLTPGLSPAQRRVLFSVAMVDMRRRDRTGATQPGTVR